MASPAVYTFQIYQGQTWRNTLRLKDAAGDPIDLTDYTARMQIRETVESATFVLELTTENGRLTIDELAGEIAVLVDADDTSAIELPLGEPGQWVYDLEIIDSSDVVTRVLQGAVVMHAEVTR